MFSPPPTSSFSLQNTTTGIFWNTISVYVPKVIVFLSTATLARLLDQEAFGLYSHALVAISLIKIVQSWGLQQALIYFEWQEQRASAGFWLAILLGLLSYGFTWIAAPGFALYFKSTESIPRVRALGLTLIFSAFETLPFAYLQKELLFKLKVVPETGRSLMKGLLSILLAYLGWRAWGLIGGHIAGSAAAVVLIWISVPWRPRARFDPQQARALLRYGGKLMANNLLAIFTANLDYLIVGRIMGVQALGIYTLAFRLPELLVKELSNVISQAIFPTLVKWNAAGQDARRGFLTSVRLINVLTLPLGAGLALLAKPFILVAFGDKWVQAWQVTQAIAVFSMLRALARSFGDLYLSQNKHSYLVYLRFGVLVVSVPALWFATGGGSLVQIAWTQVGLAGLNLAANMVMASRIFSVRISEYLKQLLPAGRAVLAMSLAVLASQTLFSSSLAQLTIGLAAGGLAYLGTLYVLDRTIFLDAQRLLITALRRK